MSLPPLQLRDDGSSALLGLVQGLGWPTGSSGDPSIFVDAQPFEDENLI